MTLLKIFGPGTRHALPLILFLLIGFAAPLAAVIGFSFTPARTFSIWQSWSLENYIEIFNSTSYLSFLWSLGLAAVTVLILALICYPIAYGLARVFGTSLPPFCRTCRSRRMVRSVPAGMLPCASSAS